MARNKPEDGEGKEEKEMEKEEEEVTEEVEGGDLLSSPVWWSKVAYLRQKVAKKITTYNYPLFSLNFFSIFHYQVHILFFSK